MKHRRQNGAEKQTHFYVSVLGNFHYESIATLKTAKITYRSGFMDSRHTTELAPSEAPQRFKSIICGLGTNYVHQSSPFLNPSLKSTNQLKHAASSNQPPQIIRNYVKLCALS